MTQRGVNTRIHLKPCQYRIDAPTEDSFGKLASTSLNNSSRPLLGFSAAVGHLTYCPTYPPTAFLSHRPPTNHPTRLISVLQEVVRLAEMDPTPLPQFPFKPPRKDSLVWRRATSTNIRGLSSLSRSWASTWCTGWSISPFQKRKYMNIFSLN